MSRTGARPARSLGPPASRDGSQDRRTPIRPSAAGATLINGHLSPGRLRYRCPDCSNSTLLPFKGESPSNFSMTNSGGQRSAVGWKNHPSLHLWTCPRVKGKQ